MHVYSKQSLRTKPIYQIKVMGRQYPSVTVPQCFELDLSDVCLHTLGERSESSEGSEDNVDIDRSNACHSTRESIVKAQQADPELRPYFEQALSNDEAKKVSICYIVKDGLLTKKWRCPLAPSDNDNAIQYLIVAPKASHTHILELAHDVPMSGHLGIRKTKARVVEHFFVAFNRKRHR